MLAARCLVVPGVLCVIYAEFGAPFLVSAPEAEPIPAAYRCYDPRTGQLVIEGVRSGPFLEGGDAGEPRVFVFYDGFAPA